MIQENDTIFIKAVVTQIKEWEDGEKWARIEIKPSNQNYSSFWFRLSDLESILK